MRSLADIAYTLQVGRAAMSHRRVVVVPGDAPAEAAALLSARTPQRVLTRVSGQREPRVVFLFPGLGGQYLGMGRGLYENEPVFRDVVDEGAEVLRDELGIDLRAVLYPAEPAPAGEATARIDLRRMLGRGPGQGEPWRDTAIVQPALFVVELALARLVESWGVRPRAVLGYSLGEYAAACVGGSLAFSDALRLVARRARLIADLPAGAMLAVPLAADEVERYLSDELSLAATNGPQQSVVAGPPAAVAALEKELAAAGIVSRRLETSHAFHSTMMEPIRQPFVDLLREVRFTSPQVPWLSNLTGGWMDAADGGYWARHMCETVRFSESLETLAAEDGELFLLELGPGQALSSLALQHPAFERRPRPAVASAIRHGYENQADLAHLYEAVGRLWLAGVEIDWPALHGGARRRRVPLPTYPFARHAYWVESKVHGYTGLARLAASAGEPQAGQELVSVPSWQRKLAPRRLPPAALATALDPALDTWLLCAGPGDGGVGEALAEKLRSAGRTVWTVEPGTVAELPGRPAAVVHLGSLADETLEAALRHGLEDLLAQLRALRPDGERPLALWTVSAAALEVSGEALRPAAATVLAATRVVPREMPGVVCRAIDVLPVSNGSAAGLADTLLAEIASGASEQVVAYRGGHRWVPVIEPAPAGEPSPLRPGGVYLLTGGTTSRGFAFASHLARNVPGVRLAIVEPASSSARRNRRLSALRAAGAEVLELTADPTDAAALRGTVAETLARFGVLHGVIHAAEPADPAAVAAAFATIEESAANGAAAGRAWLALKADGARHLDAALVELLAEPLDFALLVSSLAPLVGGLGVLYDAAAGFYLDAFRGGVGWTSLAWDFFLDDETDEARSPGLTAPAPGIAEAALDRLFQLLPRAARLIATPRALGRSWNQVAAPASVPAARTAGGSYPRPELTTAYVAPRTDTERRIAAIWETLLGVSRVGVHDGFLELGGDSLLASRLVARMREAFDLELPVRLFFEAANVEQLAREVESRQAEIAGAEAAGDAELIALIAGLSEEEVEAEIARRTAREEMANG